MKLIASATRPASKHTTWIECRRSPTVGAGVYHAAAGRPFARVGRAWRPRAQNAAKRDERQRDLLSRLDHLSRTQTREHVRVGRRGDPRGRIELLNGRADDRGVALELRQPAAPPA